MNGLQLTIPAQDGRKRPGVKIRPREVSEWLDNMPFLDLERTALSARRQLRLINRQTLAPAARLEILDHFLGTYHRLLESLPANPADAEALQPLLKRLCQDIGFGYKIVAHELVAKRNSFRETRSLPHALLGAIYTLGIHLGYYYASYQRTPRALWRECLALYSYAWQTGRENYSSTIPGLGELDIQAAFSLIALLRGADPYALPAGMIPVMRKYFESHSRLVMIENEAAVGGQSIQLTGNENSAKETADTPLHLNLTALLEQMEKDINHLQRFKQAEGLGLPAKVPASTLLCTLQQVHDRWQHQRTRAADRQAAHIRIELVNGLDAAYCVLNKGRWFDSALYLGPGQTNSGALGTQPGAETSSQRTLVLFNCTSINHSSGGLAISYRGTQTPHPQVSELVALRRPEHKFRSGWIIAVGRWLMKSESDSALEMGLQYLARDPKPVAIRARDAAGLGGDYHPAVSAVQKRGEQRVYTLITQRGVIQRDAELTIYDQNGIQHKVRCTELLESAPGFERFIYESE